MDSYACVLQFPWAKLNQEGFPLKGNWCRNFFRNNNPITLELGCGKGEYTVALASRYPCQNFIGIDIKGARMWKGAKAVEDNGIANAAFLRTDIELIESFFESGEIDEIWITFPDPQMQKTRKRLTSPRFLNIYKHLLAPGGIVHLKTDSPFLYAYTSRLVKNNNLEIITDTSDLYGSGYADPVASIKTFYEQQWLSRGLSIKYISFRLNPFAEITDVSADDIPRDDYHSYPRGIAQKMPEEILKQKKSK